MRRLYLIKKIEIGLVPKLIIAIVIGILIGQFLPESICRGVVASPGAPGGAIMTALPFLYMIFGKDLGNPDGPICAHIVALYITQDSFGTACNGSGDNARGVVVDSIYHRYILKK